MLHNCSPSFYSKTIIVFLVIFITTVLNHDNIKLSICRDCTLIINILLCIFHVSKDEEN